jgi:U3 small nucleolar RNA-associated protein 5
LIPESSAKVRDPSSTRKRMAKLLAVSAFDPTGNHYSSVVTALDTHRIRVQATNNTSSLANAFSLDKGHKVTSLSWGLSPDVEAKEESPSKKNKKRRLTQTQQQFALESQIISIGLNKGSILQYSPAANQIVGKLENPNASSINDYVFSHLTNSGWSVDVAQNVIEWDLFLFKPKLQFRFNESVNLIRVIEYNNKPHLLLASHSVYLVDIETHDIVMTFPGHVTPIHALLPMSDGVHFITAADGDRFINIYSTEGTPTVLVTQSNVLSVSHNDETVTAITEDGFVEVFTNVLKKQQQQQSTTGAKSNKKRVQQSKQSDFKIQLTRPNSDPLKIEDAFISPEFITITWLEDQSIPYFEKIKVIDLSETTTITKARPAIQAKDHTLFGQDIAAPKRYNESSTVVTSGDNLKYLDNKEVQVNKNEEEEEELDVELRVEDGPSLAEKMELLKVENTVPKRRNGKASANSLAVILTQALRSNDHSLLETVLTSRNENVLKTTIQRLDTSLAVILLERLAERIARHTNRQGQLNIWVKWVIIIHGGYLINVPNLAKSLSSLHSTLTRRASTLPRLLELQGRLDVLYSQQESNKANKEFQEEDYDDSDESDVEYIEELDDANLLDDSEDEELLIREEDGFIDVDDFSESEEEEDVEIADVLENEEVEEEVGYSDEEINGNGKDIDSDDDDDENNNEQELLKQKIAKLKAKQDKRKSR